MIAVIYFRLAFSALTPAPIELQITTACSFGEIIQCHIYFHYEHLLMVRALIISDEALQISLTYSGWAFGWTLNG